MSPVTRSAPSRGVMHMNLFDRFSRVAKANLNNVLQRWEDPEKVLSQAVEDMQKDLVKIRQSYAEVMATQKRMQRQKEQAEGLANEWYRRAQLALEKGDEELVGNRAAFVFVFTPICIGKGSALAQAATGRHHRESRRPDCFAIGVAVKALRLDDRARIEDYRSEGDQGPVYRSCPYRQDRYVHHSTMMNPRHAA